MDISKLCMHCMEPDSVNDGVCRICGKNNNVEDNSGYAAQRTILNNNFVVGRVLSVDGEGVTYLGYDLANDVKVKIREFFPKSIASRTKDGNIYAQSGTEVLYKSLLSDFIELFSMVKNLYNVKNIENVISIFDSNNTVYVVLEYFEGIPLSEYINVNGGDLTWEEAKELFSPLFKTVKELHESYIIHRGISVDTVIVTRHKELILTDFATLSLRSKFSPITPQLFDGYAAPEQYNVSSFQSEATDIYALSALLYKALTGTKTPDAWERLKSDSLLPVNSLNPDVPAIVSSAITTGLSLLSEKRFKTVDDFVAALIKEEPVIIDGEPEPAPEEEKKSSTNKYVIIALLATAVLFLAIATPTIIAPVIFKLLSNDNTTSTYSMPDKDDVVSFVVNSDEGGKKTVIPNLVGKRYDVARTQYEHDLSLVKITEEYSTDYVAGVITYQSVEANSLVAIGTKVEVKVSKGPEKTIVRNVVNKTALEATQIFEDVGIQVKIRYIFDDIIAHGRVVEIQGATAGDEVMTEDTTITLLVCDKALDPDRDAPTVSIPATSSR